MKFQWLFDRPIAHRGLHNAEFPENSMPAYQLAIENGFNIEIDVHVTKDGRVVVFHDDNLKRVCGVDKLIKDCTLAELKTYRLCNSEYTIPTFDEFLQLVDGKTGILCEIKGINPLDKKIVRATIERLKDYKGNIALQSFNFGAVSYAKRHCDLPVGELCTWSSPDLKNQRWKPANFMGKLWINRFTRPHFIAYDVRAVDKSLPENKYIKKWGEKLPILMWTINSEERVAYAQQYANNIIFEDLSAEYVESKVGTFMPFKCPQTNMP